MAKKAAAASTRINAALIRKSGDSQDERGQIANVQRMLKARGVTVRDDMWFYAGKGVKRKEIAKDPEMNRLMSLVAQDKIDTIYIEKLDRFGSDKNDEFQMRLNSVRKYGTKLYDLVEDRDLTVQDLVSDILNTVQVYESRNELRKISYRTLRTKVDNLEARGQWPSGAAPYGYGKACYSQDGKLLWAWHPTSRVRGQHYIVNDKGKLILGQSDVRIPARSKTKTEKPIIKLVPHKSAKLVRTVRLLFEWFTTQNISCRSLAIKLNDAGHLYYDKPFNHSLVMQILRNPVYVGDTHYGKVQSGDYYTLQSNGLLVDFDLEVKNGIFPQVKKRTDAERLVKRKTHDGIITPKVWKLAQDKMKRVESAKRYPPRNPDYYLRPLLICGHCKKSMTGRTEIHPSTGERVVTYFCPTYLGARSKGQDSKCKSYRITHDAAEQLLLDYVKQSNLNFDPKASRDVRSALSSQMANLGVAYTEDEERALDLMTEGLQAFREYLEESGVRKTKIAAFEKMAETFYADSATLGREKPLRRGVEWTELRKAIQIAEKAAIKHAVERVAELEEEHKVNTRSWVRGTDAMKKTIQADIDAIEEELAILRPRTVPLGDRLRQLREEYGQRHDQVDKLEKEWPQLEASAKGEAMQRLFSSVTLYWDSKFNPSPERPTREKKTEREGRWSHTLNEEKIEWGLTPEVGGTR